MKNGTSPIAKYDGSQKVVMQEVKSKSRELPYNAIQSQVRFLQGKVLTVIDAISAEREQKKAIKDLIKNAFSQQLNWLYELCGYPEDANLMEVEEGMLPPHDIAN